MACGGMIFTKKTRIKKKEIQFFVRINFFMSIPSFFAIIDLLQGTKSPFVLYMGCGGMIFIKNFKLKKKSFHFISFNFVITAP